MMNVSSQVECRRAIEALRAGVPNRDAVLALGCVQPAIEEKFREQLKKVAEGGMRGDQAPGLLVSGDFGTGKSHLLEYLQDMALKENFVCSKVVISKETPLHDPVKFYRSAALSAKVPGKTGLALDEVAMALGLNPPTPAFEDLSNWVHDPDCGLNQRFAATVFLVKHLTKDVEGFDKIVRFWSGERIGKKDLMDLLKGSGKKKEYTIEQINQRDLTIQRFQFVPRLMVAAGHSGWVLLVDEVELIGRYSFLQRAKSYAELARWAGKLQNQQFPCFTTAFAITSNFDEQVLKEKGDLDDMSQTLRDRGLEDLAKQAERGMKFIQKERVFLKQPDGQAMTVTGQKVRDIYASAYEVRELPETESSTPVDRSSVLRHYIKRWINQWDLERLYGYHGRTVVNVEETQSSYGEDPDLERPMEGESKGES